MGEEKKDNPGHITPALCEAYRETLKTEIDSIKTAIYLTGLILGIIVSGWSIFQLLMG